MSVAISLSSKMGSEKVLWSWSASLKNNKFGSTKTSSTTVGELVAAHSVLSLVPQHLDIIFRTRDKKLAEILSNSHKRTKNPVIAQLFKLIQERKGFVRCVFVSTASMNEEDKRAVKILQTISGGGKKPAPISGSTRRPVNSLLKPQGTTRVKATVTRRKKVEQPLTTGLEDWDDDGPSVVKEKKGKPVMCGSCDAPISPLTNECLCSN